MPPQEPFAAPHTEASVFIQKLKQGIFCPICGAGLLEQRSDDALGALLLCEKKHHFRVWSKQAFEVKKLREFPQAPIFKGDNPAGQAVRWWLSDPQARASLPFDIADLLGSIDTQAMCVRPSEPLPPYKYCLDCGSELNGASDPSQNHFNYQCDKQHGLHCRANVLWTGQGDQALVMWAPMPAEMALRGYQWCASGQTPSGFLPPALKEIFKQAIAASKPAVFKAGFN